MSYSFSKGAWEVRWRGGDGRQRSRRFGDDERAAQAFDEAIHDQKVKERKQASYGESGGVYPYQTAGHAVAVQGQALGWEVVTEARVQEPERGRELGRRQLERVERREVVHTKETFESSSRAG